VGLNYEYADGLIMLDWVDWILYMSFIVWSWIFLVCNSMIDKLIPSFKIQLCFSLNNHSCDHKPKNMTLQPTRIYLEYLLGR
jgi:hypothetical protein